MNAEDKLLCAPVCTLKELNNLFIELTAKNCNQRCKQCYIDFPISRKEKDFIPIEKVKQTIEQTMDENLNCIYLTGAEPMTHPDFNNILRLCLTRTNVCICTNGSFINEKKARFLKKVEDESNFSIIFQLPIAHYDEVKSDDIRSRGNYRQVMHAIKNLNKYEFYIFLNITNFYQEDSKVLINETYKAIQNLDIEFDINNIKVNEFCDKQKPFELSSDFKGKFDCENSRIVTVNGVYSCPFLANDHRGRMGSDFTDYAKKIPLETSFCATCIKNKKQMFALDTKIFS